MVPDDSEYPEYEDYRLEKTGVLRLLYLEGEGPLTEEKMVEERGRVDQYLRESPCLETADGNFYFYFFPRQKKYWAGLGVVGILNGVMKAPFFLKDFPRGLAFSFPLNQAPSWEVDFREKYAKVLEKKGIGVGEAFRWRLQTSLVEEHFSLAGTLQFFLKNQTPLLPNESSGPLS